MTKATRYVLIFTVAAYWSSSKPSSTSTDFTWKKADSLSFAIASDAKDQIGNQTAPLLTIGMLDKEMYSELRLIRTEKLALKLGSSKQGNAMRALVGSKWVEANVLKTATDSIIIQVTTLFTANFLFTWSLLNWLCRCFYRNPGSPRPIPPQTQYIGSTSLHCWAPWEKRCRSAHGQGYEDKVEPRTWDEVGQSDQYSCANLAALTTTVPGQTDEQDSCPEWLPWRSADPYCVTQPNLCCSGRQFGSWLSRWNGD